MLDSLHPYNYWEKDGQYFFDTPSGAQYVAYFLALPFANNLFSFNFDKLHTGTNGMVDCYVFDTICTILERFFANHKDSMLIVCDTADGREGARERLFESWYRKIAPEGLCKIDRSGVTEDYSLFVSLLVWDDNPDKANLISILDEYCDNMLLS